MKNSILMLSLAAACAAPLANADLGVGITTTYSPNVYLGGKTEVTPFPLVSYDNGRFNIEGVQASYRLAPKGALNNVVAFVTYDPRMLDAGESSDRDVQKLDDRDASFIGGLAYVLTTNAGQFRAGAGSDIGAVHNGVYFEARYSYHLNMGPIGFIPAIGYTYNSDKLNEHLYGVSSSEAARTRFDAFSPNWSGKYFVGLSGYMYLSRHLRITGGVRYEDLDTQLAESPIVDNDVSVIGNLGVSYTF